MDKLFWLVFRLHFRTSGNVKCATFSAPYVRFLIVINPHLLLLVENVSQSAALSGFELKCCLNGAEVDVILFLGVDYCVALVC